MKIYLGYILLAATLFSLNTQARKPAVEDFVGVMPKDYQATPKGTEVLFDFGNKVKKVDPQGNFFEEKSTVNWTGVVGLLTFMALPFFMWIFITHFGLKNQVTTKPTVPTDDNHKVAHIDDFRDKKESEEKKVS